MFRKSLIAGFALFSILFGSGNLVFPLLVGKRFPGDWGVASFGWSVAAVLLPILGYYGAVLFNADAKKYLAPLGKYVTAALIFIIMMLIGPFGAIARNINVSLGCMVVVAPNISNVAFNFVYCVIMVFLAWNPNRLVQILGSVFAPLKLMGVAIVILGGSCFCALKGNTNFSNESTVNVFIEGFKTGYQTMDLLAAIATASSIYLYIKNSLPKNKQEDKKELLKSYGYACVVGSIILVAVYTGLIFASSRCSLLLAGAPDEEIFAKIADVAIGSYASWFVAVVTTVCCLATNIALSSIFIDYVYEEFCKEKFSRHVILVVVGAIAFVMSLLGFARLCSFLGAILEKVYPLLIIFVVGRIVHYYVKR
ncbi:MAG: branched-chain amino acid transport system II carrier protein [Holosporales bacterium]|jgi:LIVCS family branched-chain amino acid:cation transporter|nr:branched-chain amino acid transport system II carrier protein [Holosporales bacterium]